MSSKKDAMKKKLENMHLGERINYGYRMVITMMLISGLLSIAVIGVLFFNMLNYVNKVNAADQAVKTCRINVTAAARNVREMALNPDKSTYDDYEQGAKEKLEDVDVQLKTIKKSGIVPENQYNEYSKALSDWANIGYSIMNKIKAGQKDEAVDQIINECTPKLNKTVELAKEINKLTDERSLQAVVSTYVCAAVGLIVIIICLTCAWRLTKRTGKIVLDTILEPLHAIEDVAKELTEGNLHSTLEYHSEDEIGRLAHSMRKSIRILGSYVDDIDRAMKLFADGHFDAQPEVEWRGDFVGILHSFMEFEKSMAVTIKGIQNVSSEVSSAAEQVAASSNDLADGATNQAAVVEELTATVAGVSEQVEQNSKSAQEILDDILANHKIPSEVKAGTETLVLPEVPEGSKIEIVAVNPEGIIGLDGKVTTPENDTDVIVTIQVTDTNGATAKADVKVLVRGEKADPDDDNNGNDNNGGNDNNNGNDNNGGNDNNSGNNNNGGSSNSGSHNNGSTSGSHSQSVQTGDNANVIMWAVLLVAAVAAVGAVVIIRRKKK